MVEEVNPEKDENERKDEKEDLDSIIENHEQIYIRLESKDELTTNELYLKIHRDLLEKYDSQIEVYRLRTIDGMLLDYSRLSYEERKQVSEYLTQISEAENLELIVEGLNPIKYQ